MHIKIASRLSGRWVAVGGLVLPPATHVQKREAVEIAGKRVVVVSAPVVSSPLKSHTYACTRNSRTHTSLHIFVYNFHFARAFCNLISIFIYINNFSPLVPLSKKNWCQLFLSINFLN